MTRGRHAADDGSFGRSAGMAAGRGALLLAVAVLLGIVLLNAADDSPTDTVSAARPSADATTSLPPAVLPPPTTASTVPLRAAKDVRVLTANGTSVKGVGGRVKDVLKGAGYNVLAPTDAKPATASAVYFAPGFEREAQAVAQYLALPPTTVQPMPVPPPVTDLREANVLVVVGPDMAQRMAGASSTTTTARATGTTTATTARTGSTTATTARSITPTTRVTSTTTTAGS